MSLMMRGLPTVASTALRRLVGPPAKGLATIIRHIVPERYRPIGYLTHLARCQTGGIVPQGPFAGMQYARVSQGSAYIPKLLGIYEREIVPQVEALVARRPQLVVDLGAAEGYYAVGLALRLPEARVIAFEMEPHGQRALREMAALNSVHGRIAIKGLCKPDDLAEVLGDERNVAVVCDVEGCENELMDPIKVAALQHAAVLVELHDFLTPGVTDILKHRFDATHHITHVWQEPRSSDDFPWRTLGTRMLPASYIHWAVSEWRPVRMSWLWLDPKQENSR